MIFGVLKGKPAPSAELRITIVSYAFTALRFKSIPPQTIRLVDRDGSIKDCTTYINQRVYVDGNNSGQPDGTAVLTFQNREAIQDFISIGTIASFPDLTPFVNLIAVQLNAQNSTISFTNPYLNAVKKRLKSFTCTYGPTNMNDTDSQLFFSGLDKIEALSFELAFTNHNPSYFGFLAGLNTTLKTFFTNYWYNSTIPDISSNTNLTSFTATGARIADGFLGNVIDKFPASNKLKTVNLSANNMTLTQIDILVNKVYAWANTNSNNSVTLSIGGNNASPTGTYDGTTDWSGGVPTSPKAKLWHLVNSRSWIITYTP